MSSKKKSIPKDLKIAIIIVSILLGVFLIGKGAAALLNKLNEARRSGQEKVINNISIYLNETSKEYKDLVGSYQYLCKNAEISQSLDNTQHFLSRSEEKSKYICNDSESNWIVSFYVYTNLDNGTDNYICIDSSGAKSNLNYSPQKDQVKCDNTN